MTNPALAVARSRYRCGRHTDYLVSAKGRGCVACRHEQTERERSAQDARRARKARLEGEA